MYINNIKIPNEKHIHIVDAFLDRDRNYLPSEKGIYFVYVGKVIDDPYQLGRFKMLEPTLIYTGEAKDSCDCHNNDDGSPKHKHYPDFLTYKKAGFEIAYAFAILPGIEYTRKLIESALIYEFQPPINIKNKYSFNHRDTIIRIDLEAYMEFPLNGRYLVKKA